MMYRNTFVLNSFIKKYDKIGDKGIQEVVDYLKVKKCFEIFPYEFVSDYNQEKIEVYKDKDGHKYVIYKEKRLYCKDSDSDENIKKYINGIMIEQDYRCPHSYFGSNGKRLEYRFPSKGDVLADVGAAEGFFTLDVIDKISKAYLFECDKSWIEPLQRTFAPYKEKIEIVRKYVGDNNSDDVVTLDSFFEEKEIDFLKADIEGAEEKMLIGSPKTFSKKIKKVLMVCYHSNKAEKELKEYLDKYGLITEVNYGYMLLANSLKFQFKKPWLRHGVIYGYRC